MRRAWHGETKGKSTTIQSRGPQSERNAGSERMTRENERGEPSPRGSGTLRRVTSGAPQPHWGRGRAPDGRMVPSASFAADWNSPSLG
jgi:hypothetical protein